MICMKQSHFTNPYHVKLQSNELLTESSNSKIMHITMQRIIAKTSSFIELGQ